MEVLVYLVLLVVVFKLIMGLASFCTWFERKGSALIQDRVGANRAGAVFELKNPLVLEILSAHRYLGLLLLLLGLGSLSFVYHYPSSPYALPWGVPILIAMLGVGALAVGFAPQIVRMLGILGVINTLLNDAVKSLLKEDFLPRGTSQFMHCLAPFLAVLPVFLAFAVIPLAPEFTVFGTTVRPQLAQLDAGVLFILAMGSIAVYGVALAGWVGNNKFSLLGALRAAAQMISYELAMGLSFVAVILCYGTLDLFEMVDKQQIYWGVLYQPITFIVLFIVGMAETKRGPFDLPESESELVAGYFTEYSGMKFLIFWLGEFAEIALFALILSILFFGGWHLPFVTPQELANGIVAGLHLVLGWALPFEWLRDQSWFAALIGHVVLMGKVVFFCMLQIVIRWTLPRFRYDQLMTLGWKYLLPLSMVNLMVYAALKVGGAF